MLICDKISRERNETASIGGPDREYDYIHGKFYSGHNGSLSNNPSPIYGEYNEGYGYGRI